MKNLIATLTFIGLCGQSLNGQSHGINRWETAFHIMDRINILHQADTTYDLSITDIRVKDAIKIARRTWQNQTLSTVERNQILHFMKDNYEFLAESVNIPVAAIDKPQPLFRPSTDEEVTISPIPNQNTMECKPILKYFYKDPANFLRIKSPNFNAYINPILVTGFANQVDNTNTIFQNTRGIEVKAYIDKKIYIYTQLLENQRSFFNHIDSRISKFNSVPGQGKSKGYSSSVIDNLKGYDFFTAKSVIGIQASKSLNLEFGHGNHFIGHGYRSLLLSDYAPNRLYLSLDWQFWRFKYRNIYSELATTTRNLTGGDDLLPKKFNVTHFLSFKASDKLELGIFETVVFAREKQFELNYLNPVILYRAIEFNLGSPDNVLVGADMQYKIAKGLAFYGQLILDEFYLKEVRASSGWWANKFGAQIGLKYYNAFGINNLDIRLETNAVRPFTYAHRDTIPVGRPYSVSSYAHANLPLAHPLGANFKEYLGHFTYRPTPKLTCQAMVLNTLYGDDPAGKNWGNDILLDNNIRAQEYNNKIGQGIKTIINEISARASYEVFHNYFVDIYGSYRTLTLPTKTKNQHYIGGGIRVNIAHVPIDY